MTYNEYRTHNCGELRINHAGQKVKIAGWVNSIRNLGGLTFLTIRDHFGLTQVILDGQDIPSKESVVSIEGIVLERESKNSNLKTGDIEIEVLNLELLNTSEEIPFMITDQTTALEETRLKYRYLDIRRNEIKNNLLLRNDIMFAIREYLNSLNFMEVETPILCKSTPEGARDYLVPSRVNNIFIF